MKNFLLVGLFSFVLSSTYEIQIKMDDYQGIRQGSTAVSYNGENAGKVKRISEADDGGYLVTLKIYETFDINGDMLFKVENRKLVVDLDGMEKLKIAKEEEKALQLKLEQERIAAEQEKARQLKIAKEEEKALQLKLEQERIAAEEEKARQLKIAKEEEKALQLKLEQERIAAEEEKARQLKMKEELLEKEKIDKTKAQELPIEEAKEMAEESVEDQDKNELGSDRDLLKEQYDVAPKLKRKLKISSKKYKDKAPVTLKFLINKKGYVEEVSIKKSSGDTKFDAAAKKAIKKSKWHPAKKHDISVSAWHELEISF
ncbi:TonB family protein [bacterium]|nr:TonB family protein [bacterium]